MPPSDPSPRTRFVGVGTSVAVILVTVGAVLPTMTKTFDPVGPAGFAATTAIGVIYTAVGTLGVYAAERRGSRAHRVAAVFALVVLASVVVPVSRGTAWLMTLPAVTMSILFLSRAQATCAISLMVAMVAGVIVRRAVSGVRAVEDLLAHAAGFAFVVVFSRMAQTHHQARTRIEQLAGELGVANQRLREHAAQAHDLATTKERNRIAREIHDGLGHYLTVVFVQLEAAEKLFAKDPARSVAAIAKARELTHEGLDEVRRAVSVLRGSGSTARTLLSSLEALACASTESGLDTRFLVHGAPRPLAEPTEFALYRAAQEALTNVSRHAAAHHVKLDLVFTAPSTVALRVEDDGIGCERAEGGFGLVGLRERAELVGGEVAIRTARGQGFALELRVPG
jgi:signal transduction histidine kinase